MRLVILHGSNDLYGASRVLLDDCRLLIEAGHDVEVCLPCAGPLSALLRGAGATVTESSLHVLRLSDPTSLRRVPARLPAWRTTPDAVVLWTLALMAYLPILRLSRKPVLVSVHELLPSRMGGLLAGMTRATTGKVQINSHAVGAWLESCGVPASRLSLAYPAASTPVPSPPRVDPCATHIGLLGRVNGAKGHLEAVRLVELARDRHEIDLRLTLAGGAFRGQERHLEQLTARVAALDFVTFVGEVRDARVVFPDIDLLLVWSQRPEPFGVTPLEAWSAGRRTVSNGVGGASEAAWLVDGLVLPHDDPIAAADELAWVTCQAGLLAAPSIAAPASILATKTRRAASWRDMLASL